MKLLGILFILMSILVSVPGHAQKLPLWELGFGVGILNLPFYRGADTSKSYLVPIPLIFYRGERFRIDDAGVSGQIFKSDRIKLELSLAGGVPVASDDDSPRVGMPDLDPTIELGPSLEIKLWSKDNKRRSLYLNIPLRASFSISSSQINHQGWSFAPFIQYGIKSTKPDSWKTAISFGPLYADKDYHNYFYEVESKFVTTVRPEYHSNSGYNGTRVTLTLQKNINDVWLGAFYRYDNLSSTAFEDSPLVVTDNYKAFGFAVTWTFLKSKTLVERPD